ncbi:MAG: 4Fe-4S dicluster domain-containing protein [bacterium]
MPELTPLPFAVLLHRMFNEFRRESKIFDLPSARFWRGAAAMTPPDMSTRIHGRAVCTPLGAAAGPHTQMAQNIVLAWLGGCRAIELKTIQSNDRLTIPRPCIDAANVCYNVEFSQELRLDQSLVEYVKARMLLTILRASGILGAPDSLPPLFHDCVFVMSCGYTLEGIRCARVQNFIRSMTDASAVIEGLRLRIPDEFAEFRRIEYEPRIADGVTLSTFHNCPAHEIESIAAHLLQVNRLPVVIKLNPTMLGRECLEDLLRGRMGYADIALNDAAFDDCLRLEEAAAMAARLRAIAAPIGLEVGVKISNTLEIINHRHVFPASERVMYLSGPPLHPIALELALRFRQTMEARCGVDETATLPVSFSGGAGKHNFAGCVACGFAPVTICADLLKPGGYGRLRDCLESLRIDMTRLRCDDVGRYMLARAGVSGPLPLGISLTRKLYDAVSINHQRLASAAADDPRFQRSRNSSAPPRNDSRLGFFDCISCGKCVPVCPNNAIFWHPTPLREIAYTNFVIMRAGCPRSRVIGAGDAVRPAAGGTFIIRKPLQIAITADACNECGNCDTFCPEHGGPYRQKPCIFTNHERWRRDGRHNGFLVHRGGEWAEIHGRFAGYEHSLRMPSDRQALEQPQALQYTCPAGIMIFSPADLSVKPLGAEPIDNAGRMPAVPEGHVDIGICLMLWTLLRGILSPDRANHINAQFQ